MQLFESIITNLPASIYVLPLKGGSVAIATHSLPHADNPNLAQVQATGLGVCTRRRCGLSPAV
jgi:hypothetical protein